MMRPAAPGIVACVSAAVAMSMTGMTMAARARLSGPEERLRARADTATGSDRAGVVHGRRRRRRMVGGTDVEVNVRLAVGRWGIVVIRMVVHGVVSVLFRDQGKHSGDNGQAGRSAQGWQGEVRDSAAFSGRAWAWFLRGNPLLRWTGYYEVH